MERYFLGCPIWSFKGWVGNLFQADARPGDYLRQYAAVFNTVEGNTTFYALPAAETVARWREDTPEGFEFCFKFPRWITHEKRLRQAEPESVEFLGRLASLGDRLGPYLLQLPPSFGPADLPVLESYLDHLPSQYLYVVEVRHRSFFAQGKDEQRLNSLLASRSVDRAIFDTRALRTADPSDPAVRGAQQRKPDLPVHIVATGPHPLYRFVAHPVVEANLTRLEELAGVVAAWIEEGRRPYVFMHSPYDLYAPQLGREFHRLLQQRVAVGVMPPWPGEESPTAQPVAEPFGTQLSLF